MLTKTKEESSLLLPRGMSASDAHAKWISDEENKRENKQEQGLVEMARPAKERERDENTWRNRLGLTVSELETRLLRACKTLRVLPDPERKYQILHNCWPEMIREAEEAYGYTEERMPRFRPTPGDVSDCLVALRWARAVTPKDFRHIWWRSFGMSFRAVAARLGRSDERARQLYQDVLWRIWFEAI